MPTVAEWQLALSREYRINIESSTSLCEEVSQRQQRRDEERRGTGLPSIPSKDLGPWPPSGRQGTISIRPIDLLHALGRITTPPVTELIDLSSTWAEIRYIWAFQPNFDNRIRSLRLSPAVKQLDFHQKTLLSDEFGVGFAAHYMATFEQATDPVDAFIANRRGQVRRSGNSRRSLPDYIFSGPRQDQYFVVECKGTQSDKSTAIGQLQRGSEQVLTVDIDPPASVTRLVVGAWLQRTITILVIDPEPESELRKLSRWSIDEVSRFAYAKRLTYIGDCQGASTQLRNLVVEQKEHLVLGPRKLTFRKTGSAAFVGSEQIREMPDGRQVQMFRGVESELYDAILHEGKTVRRLPQEADMGNGGEAFSLEVSTEDGIATVRSISRDGSLFEVQIR